MTGNINSLLKQAVTTFTGLKEALPRNLEKLRQKMDKMRGADLGLHSEYPLFKTEEWMKQGKAPVTYIDVYEDLAISVGVFIISENMKLPLHDHPQMHGLIKVLHGALKISSFTVAEQVNENQFEVHCHQPAVVHSLDPPCILEPQKQNLHEIESVNGVAAFLDILAPPYEVLIPEFGERKCAYYQRIRQTGINRMLVEKIQSPSWFWCDQAAYSGPAVESDFMSRDKESDSGTA